MIEVDVCGFDVCGFDVCVDAGGGGTGEAGRPMVELV